MNILLKVGDTIKAETAGVDCKIESFIGGGGQGEVYRVLMDRNPMALKWYFSSSATAAQRDILKRLVKMGRPDGRFLWPEDLATSPKAENFGYVMALRPDHYKSMFHLMNRKTEPSFRALATAGYHLADSFYQLHAKGLCYRDISFGNVFFDPDSGDVLVCDNDNVSFNGEGEVTVGGTPRFIAPELVRGDPGVKPSMDTDLFSLAVLLFYMFMIHHPLEGERESTVHCFDLAAMRKIYGTEALFIFDPNDDSNRPVPGLHDNALAYWPIYPQFFRDRFVSAFTDGIRDPYHGRVRETVWRQDMVSLRDAIFYCGNCGAENFYDGPTLRGTRTVDPCWSCKKAVVLPPRLRIGRDIVMLNHNTKLYPHHTSAARWDFAAPVAEVTQNPRDPSIWGLKNLSTNKWTSTTADGTIQEIEPGRNVRLAVGTHINFGATEGEIRA